MFNPKLNLLPIIILHFDCDCIINEDLYDKLKKELSEIIDNENFSIIEFQRGSAILKIVLIGDLAIKGIKASKQGKTSEEVTSVLEKIESKKFACLGNNYSSDIKFNIPDYSKEENRINLVNFLKESSKNNEDILQATTTISDEEFNNILENIDIKDILIKQEINQKKFILNNLEEFNEQIESVLEQTKKESIFEFSVVGLSLINRDKEDYPKNKHNCNNVRTKFLFHGTSTDSSSLITISNFRKANTAFFGPGIYMTDMLDYAGFYAHETSFDIFENHHKIRKVNEAFNIVASQVFYDESKFENCYIMEDTTIQEQGIRYVHVNAKGSPLPQGQTRENGCKKFIGTEFVIPSEKQILPLYSITKKRNEYYCLWKDYHFTHQTSFTEHALHVKNIAKQLLGINMYGVGEFEDAITIIKRKKYNKVILLSNVGNKIDQTKEFIKEIRNILRFNVIVLFFTASISHLNWIKDFPNALFTTKDDFFKEYILNYNETGLNNLKHKIEENYGQKLNNFHADLSYPLFDEVESNDDYSYLDID